MSGAVTRINSNMYETLFWAIVIYSMNPGHCNVDFPQDQTWPSQGKAYVTSCTCSMHGSLLQGRLNQNSAFVLVWPRQHLANCPLPLTIPQNQIWLVQEDPLVLWSGTLNYLVNKVRMDSNWMTAFWFPAGTWFFYSLSCPNWLWGPPSLLPKWISGVLLLVVK
jgi:hypothetical protein